MNKNSEEKVYTQEEIKNMSYWQLWQLRRKAGLWYFMPLLAVYTFLIYAFIKCIITIAIGSTLEFKVDPWIYPILLIVGPLYYYGHEYYYKNIYLKKK